MTSPSPGEYANNILYSGAQYSDPGTPLWLSAFNGLSTIAPNLQVSSITITSNGAMILENTTPNNATIIFDRPIEDLINTPSLITMASNTVLGGSVANISIVNNTKTYYDDLALGNLLVYGGNTIGNPSGLVGSIGQYQNQTAMSLNSRAVYTSSIWISTINGVPYGSGTTGPDIDVSTIQINPFGLISLNSSGTSSSVITAGLFFKYTPDLESTYNPALKMTTNNLGSVLGVSTIEDISVTLVDPIEGIKYDRLALGDLLVYGTNQPKVSTLGQVALIHQYEDTTDVEVLTTGFHTSNLIASTLNGFPFPGSATVPANIQISSMVVNPDGSISLDAIGNRTNASTASIIFNKTPDIFGRRPISLGVTANTTVNSSGFPTVGEVVSLTNPSSGFFSTTVYSPLALGSLLVYGNNNPVTSTIGQVAILQQWTNTTDLYINTSGIHTESTITSTLVTNTAYLSTLYVSSIQDYSFIVSTANVIDLITKTLSSSTADVPFLSASTIGFNPSLGGVNLGGIDLGLGGFLGGLTGELVSGAMTTTISGAALGTGIVSLVIPRTNNYITYPGSLSTFQSINTQTQLQFSTLGEITSTFTRFVSSIDNGTITPGFEYVVSTLIPPNSLCIRSFTDPLNPANPSTYTSTLQSFGFWIQVPVQNISTVVNTFNVTSTLFASSITTYGISVKGDVYVNDLYAYSTIKGSNIITSSISTTQTIITSSLSAKQASISTVFLSSINDAQYPPLYMAPSSFATSSISTYNMQTNIGSISSLSVSSINGSQFNPGGLIANGVFSTLLVSSLATTSSIITNLLTGTTISVANNYAINTLGTNMYMGGVSISSFTVTAPDIITSSVIAQVGLFRPPGGGPGLTLITGQNIQTSNVQTSTLSFYSIFGSNISTQGLNISSINDAPYPPPFNSTVIGNFNVTSTLRADQIIATTSLGSLGSLSVASNIGANGSITGNNITGQSLTSLTSIVANTSIVAANGVIGNVIIGPAGTLNCRTFSASTINTSANIIGGGSISASGSLSGTSLIIGTTSALPNIVSVSSINGLPYPYIPTQPSVSSFNQLFTSSFMASTINISCNAYLANLQVYGNLASASSIIVGPGGIVTQGNISSLSFHTTGIDIGISSGIINTSSIISQSGRYISSVISSFYVSSINNRPYPDISSYNQNPIFSTITVSSTAVIGGYLTAQTANIGGISFTGSGIENANLITASNVNASQKLISGQVSTGIVYALSNITTPIVNGSVINNSQLYNSGFISTSLINIPQGGNINLGYLTKINGADTNEISLGTGFVNPTVHVSSLTTIAPAIITAIGAFTPIGVGLSTLITINALDDIGTVELTGYKIISSSAVLAQTTITPGNIILGGGYITDITFQTTGSGIVDGNWNVLRTLSASNLSVSTIASTIIKKLNTPTAPSMFQIGGQSNTGIQPSGPNPPSPIGISELITGSIYQTGQYNYGSGSGGVFSVNTPYPMPNTYFCCRYPCIVRVICQSFANAGSLGTQNANTMNGVWDVYFGQTGATTIGGPYVDAIQIVPVYQNNAYLSAIAVSGVSNTYQIAPATTINDGRPPTSVAISWSVQPLYVLL